MTKYTMLGVNAVSLKCCLLSCLIPFDKLDVKNLETSDFKHDCTDWGGCDTIPRTLSTKGLKQTGSAIKLENPLSFSGTDSDMGCEHQWTFNIDEIRELEPITNNYAEKSATVIHCKDCQFCMHDCEPEHSRTTHYCEKLKKYTDKYFFCGYAETKF